MAAKKSGKAKKKPSAGETLRAYGLSFPGAEPKSSWEGHADVGVRGKTFIFLSTEEKVPRLTCKLPQSAVAALMLPFASPTAYGLGKSGWVTAEFPQGKMVPEGLLRAWIEESYRAVAPKKLAAAYGLSAPRPPAKAPSKTLPRGRARA